jgi:HK97 family phage portal protein
MIPPLGSVSSAAGLLVSQATSMTVSAVHASVRVLSNDVARCTPNLYQIKGDGSRGDRDSNHPVAKLLKRPNRIQTWFEFIRDMVAGYLLRGNGYAAIIRDRRGNPVELILINPDAVMVLEAYDGQIFYNVNRIGLFQMAVLQDFPVAIPAEDILHLRGLAFNMLIGASTIGLARDSIGLAMGQSQQQSRWMANGARPSVVLQTDRTLTEPAAKRLKQNWLDFSASYQNVGGTAVLENGVKAQALQLTSVDLDFINQCNLTIQDISRFWGVPVRKLGQPDMTRGSTIIQEEQVYVNSAVSPLLEMIEQKFERVFDLDTDERELDLNEDSLLRADPLTRYNLGRIGILTGMVTPNEWRRGERLPPQPGGDVLMFPTNTAALGSNLTGTAPDGAGRPPAGQEPTPGVATGGNAADDVAPEG